MTKCDVCVGCLSTLSQKLSYFLRSELHIAIYEVQLGMLLEAN